MTIAIEASPAGPQMPGMQPAGRDRRGSWIPNGRMIAAKILELRKRRGLMIALIAVDIGLPAIFLAVRLISHAVDPKSYGPAGGYDVFTPLVSNLMYVFGFIVAATLGCTAGCSDLSDGVFRHLVVTGRSRLALYLARIPAGTAIFAPLVAVGFAIVCVVCVYAAPTTLSYQGVAVPQGLSVTGFETWAEAHYSEVICDFPYPGNLGNFPCGPNGLISPTGAAAGGVTTTPTAEYKAAAVKIARFNYDSYKNTFLVPPVSLMIESGLWVELEALTGFMIGLGLGSLIGQRTVSVILMIVLELIVTPIVARTPIPHLVNLQRAIVGVSTAHLEPKALVPVFGGGGGPGAVSHSVPETTKEAAFVIVCWLVAWSVIGARRMMKRDV
ncbi:MAG: hypothetical protein ABSB54_02715 [Acidimicrobiales bacterium]|jgi:hypothetical protein